MEYISSDSNVWFDFNTIGRIDVPFRLPWKYLMNQDAIEDELLYPSGLKTNLIHLGLEATELSEKEFYFALEISDHHPQLTKYDSSALAIAKMRKIVLLTGDAKLRRVALDEGVTVIGTIGVLDKAVELNVISNDEYRDCIQSLIANNGQEIRLPLAELEKRLDEIRTVEKEAKE